jgi:hypothetical protein
LAGPGSISCTTQLAAADLAGLLDLLDRVHRQIDRDREADAHNRRTREDLRIDADHLAARVQQRPAGVALVDRHVGLDERHVALVGTGAAAERADDAGGDRVVEAERRADRDHPLPGERVGIADAHGRQVASIFSRATSYCWSLPTTLALSSRRSASLTVTSSAPSTT